MKLNTLNGQCMSILMSSLSETDKLESLKSLAYDDETEELVNEWVNYLLP